MTHGTLRSKKIPQKKRLQGAAKHKSPTKQHKSPTKQYTIVELARILEEKWDKDEPKKVPKIPLSRKQIDKLLADKAMKRLINSLDKL